jgi:hypothetical protein
MFLKEYIHIKFMNDYLVKNLSCLAEYIGL